MSINAEDLRTYISNKRKVAEAARQSLNQGYAFGGASTIQDRANWDVLEELERFLDWVDEGKPAPVIPFTKAQLDAFRAAKAAGATLTNEQEQAIAP
jgi:hypothetical protein